jgi:3-oxoacyl-[acyl-carrier protein] reductase
MDLKIKDKFFIVGGAGSGFGKSIALALAGEGARVLAVSRTGSKLLELKNAFPDNIELLTGDLSSEIILSDIASKAAATKLAGVFFNSGGPVAGTAEEITLQQWDEAYRTVLRWKIALTKLLLPQLKQQQYGRLVYLESVSVKQPVENLVLSNALRAAVTGFVKTLSQEVAKHNITANVLAPGYHDTDAIKRLIAKKQEQTGMGKEEIKNLFTKDIPTGSMGNPDDLASLALWLLSPLSRYVTGQTISHDGGLTRGLFG